MKNSMLQVDELLKKRTAELKIVDAELNEAMKPNHPQIVIEALLLSAEERLKLADTYFQEAKYIMLNKYSIQ